MFAVGLNSLENVLLPLGVFFFIGIIEFLGHEVDLLNRCIKLAVSTVHAKPLSKRILTLAFVMCVMFY